MDPHLDGVIFQSSPEEAARRLGRDHPPLSVLDVRQVSVFIRGRLPGSVPTPRSLPATGEVLVVGADSTDPRVRPASLDLLRRGYRVSELAGGFLGWVALDLPVERGAFEAQFPTNGGKASDVARDSTSSSARTDPAQGEPDSGPDDTDRLSTLDDPLAGGGKTLFWDVDTQVDFMDPDGKLYVPEAETLLDNLAELGRLADRRGFPVLASADDHEPDDAEISEDPDFATAYPPHCMRGTEGAARVAATQRPWTLEVGHEPLAYKQLKAAAATERPLILVHKKHFDVFTNPNVEPLLRAMAPNRIVLYGVALDVCNKAAVEGLLDRDYSNLTVVTDATKPIRKEVAEEILQGWKERGVELATTAEVEESVGG